MSCVSLPNAYPGARFVLQVDVAGSERNLTGKTVKLLVWIKDLETPAQARTWTPTTVINPGLATQAVQYTVLATDLPRRDQPYTANVMPLENDAPFWLHPAEMTVGAAPVVPP